MANQRLIEASLTRPANVTAYTAGDVIAGATAAVLTFAGAALTAGAGGRILGAVLVSGANVATKLLADLWLLDTTIATLDDDNAAFTPTDAEAQSVVAVVPFLTAASWSVGDLTADAGGNAVYAAGNLNMPYVCAATTTSLFGVLIARNAYIPVSAEVLRVRLVVEQN